LVSIQERESFLSVTAAAKHAGCSRWLLWHKIKSGELPVYQNHLDRRQRLIRLEDLERLMLISPWDADKEAA
jgi:hypothetical protein